MRVKFHWLDSSNGSLGIQFVSQPTTKYSSTTFLLLYRAQSRLRTRSKTLDLIIGSLYNFYKRSMMRLSRVQVETNAIIDLVTGCDCHRDTYGSLKAIFSIFLEEQSLQYDSSHMFLTV